MLDAIPAPIIAHFLKDADTAKVPRLSCGRIRIISQRAIRSCANMQGKPAKAGVYVTDVEPGTAVAESGTDRNGDIITAIGNNEIDQNGNYVDPIYGKIEFTNLITARVYSATRCRCKFIARANRCSSECHARTSRRRTITSSRPTIADEPPAYYVLGGLIFQELSRQYLREWGGNWLKDAPQRFVYLDRFQSELFPEGNRQCCHAQPDASGERTLSATTILATSRSESERQRD